MVTIDVSPGVGMVKAPWAAPISTASSADLPSRKDQIMPLAKPSPLSATPFLRVVGVRPGAYRKTAGPARPLGGSQHPHPWMVARNRVVFTISSTNGNIPETLLRNDAATAEPMVREECRWILAMRRGC